MVHVKEYFILQPYQVDVFKKKEFLHFLYKKNEVRIG